MHDKDWVLVDTETTGFVAPIMVVELDAHRMRGWEKCGPPFRQCEIKLVSCRSASKQHAAPQPGGPTTA
jgi:hypothetical protein